MSHLRTLLLCVVAAAPACLPGDLSGDQRVLVIARDDGGGYGLQERAVAADDLNALDGDTSRFLNRPTLVIDNFAGTAEIRGEQAIHVDFARDGDTLVATDFQGLVAVTAYHHLQQAHDYFRELGLGDAAADAPALRVLFLPKVRVSVFGEEAPAPLTDNALFIFPLRSFVLVEENVLDDLPMAANEGVIAHEYSHAVMHHLTSTAVGADEPPGLRFGWDTASNNTWAALHEGLADVHGAALTGDPDFTLPTTKGLALDRDLSDPHVLGQDHLAALTGLSYDPYALGSVFASMFWTYAGLVEQAGASRADALREMGWVAFEALRTAPLGAGGFAIADYLDAAVAAAPDPGAMCAAALDHFALIADQLTGCP